MASWERGYGDFEMKPDLDTLRPVPWHEGTVLLLADLQWERRHGRRRLAAPDPAPPARPARRARADRQRRHRARVHRLQGHLRGGLEEGLPRPRAGQPLQHRLLAARHRAGRAADPPDPQRDGRRRDDGRELQGRVQPRPARDQLPLRGRARGRRRPRRSTRTAPRRSPPRRSMAITFMAKFNEAEGNSCHIHCSLAQAEGGANAFAADQPAVRALHRRPARLHGRADAVLRAARQLLQALRRGLVRADGGRLGQRQPHLLDARRRPRRGAAGREPAAGRRRQPLPGAGGDDRRRAARDRRRARARAAARRQRLHGRQAPRARPTCTPRATASPPARSPARRSAPRSSTTTSTAPGSSSTRSSDGHRLGALPGLRAAL